LILHGRNYPFVTELPDIDEYRFKFYKPAKKSNKRTLPNIIRYDLNKVYDEITNKKRPVPFSIEVHGEDKYYKDAEAKAKSKKDDIFDW